MSDGSDANDANDAGERSAATRLAVAERAARAGGALAVERFRRDVDVVANPGSINAVTRTDRDVQRRVVDVVRESFPDDAVVGEEADAGTAVPDEGPVWVVDPIDGTNNFVRGLRTWGTSVAAVVDGAPVAAVNHFPALDDTYAVGPGGVTRNGRAVAVRTEDDPARCTVAPTVWWDADDREAFAAAARAVVERFGDMRRTGSTQATLSRVAAGGLDGAFTDVTPHPWDSVAGAFAVERAGGVVTDLDGEDWRWAPDVHGLVAASEAAHAEVLDAARELLAVR
ncbi:inositol monophosphatase family protein [Halomarina ordinaria]|uniref:fructose-bisphosphatase n=1 Tax=Halomarina ordinaria TaxID=3033939 RepID=A0ABD5U435_9EURY|nr:inositol monophosphatase family protein [Halomarina sp. PSRA2]